MKHCKNCDLKFDGEQTKCVFCNSPLDTISNEEPITGFPSRKPYPIALETIRKSMGFVLLFVLAVTILLNVYLFEDRMYWLLTLFSSIYIYLVTVILTDLSKNAVGKMGLISLLTTCEIIGVFMFFNIGLKEIVLTYIYPAIIVINFIGMFILFAISKGRKAYDYLVYILINILWGITPLFFILFKVVTPTWPSSMCLAISLLVAIGLFIFERKKTKEELKRRLHI